MDELAQVAERIEALRLNPLLLERELCDHIAAALNAAGILHHRECVLGPRCRIDFLTDGGVGIEVKKGKPCSTQVAAQLERYAAWPEVQALLIVVERSLFVVPDTVGGRPVRYVAISRSWGLAT